MSNFLTLSTTVLAYMYFIIYVKFGTWQFGKAFPSEYLVSLGLCCRLAVLQMTLLSYGLLLQMLFFQRSTLSSSLIAYNISLSNFITSIQSLFFSDFLWYYHVFSIMPYENYLLKIMLTDIFVMSKKIIWDIHQQFMSNLISILMTK